MTDNNERDTTRRAGAKPAFDVEKDLLAAAFTGLAQRHLRGAPRQGDDTAALARSLRNLADALDAFNNYPPGTFIDLGTVTEKPHDG